jgi:hypothetical protein
LAVRSSLRKSDPDELLVASPTDFDADVGSLRAILAEWARPNLTRRERLEHLAGKTPRGHNGKALLKEDAIGLSEPAAAN